MDQDSRSLVFVRRILFNRTQLIHNALTNSADSLEAMKTRSYSNEIWMNVQSYSLLAAVEWMLIIVALKALNKQIS